MRIILFLCCAFLARHGVTQNTCATAQTIVQGVHVIGAVNGGQAPEQVCSALDGVVAEHGEWYRYTATADTLVLVSTDVAGQSVVNTRFQVYSGTCDALTCVVGNDGGGPNHTSRAGFNATEGETYLIAFDDRWTANGFSFEVKEVNYPVANMEPYILFEAGFLNIGGTPMAVVDMNNDGLDDAVSVTQTLVHINRQLPEGGFEPIGYQTNYAEYPASWSLCAGDLDGNGHRDLLYGGQYGVSFLMAEPDGNGFTAEFTTEYVFSQRSNMIDINNDGHLDAFVCHDVAPNVYYLSDGAGNREFHQGGLGYSCGNYGSIWVDHDNDGDMDLYVAKCGCDPQDLLMRNDGNGNFVQIVGPLGNGDYHQSWSSAWGDLDNDGDMDVLVGSSAGTDHKLMRNNGDGTYTNVTEGSGLDIFWGQGIEWATHDLDSDGLLDIMGSYSVLKNMGDMRFAWNSISLPPGGVGDLNNDGALDVFGYGGLMWGDDNGNHWTRVNLHGTVSNKDGIGARVTVTSALGSQIREVRSGDGFRYMSSLMPHFGLGADESIERITVRWPSGIVQVVEAPPVDQVITIVEPLSTGSSESASSAIHAYPNPAHDILRIDGVPWSSMAMIEVIDLAGRVVLRPDGKVNAINLSDLEPAFYVLRVVSEERVAEFRFRKE